MGNKATTFNDLSYFEQYDYLEKLGYTEGELNYMWQKLVNKHAVVTQLHNEGLKWQDLPICTANALPEQYKTFFEENNNGN